MVKRLRTGQLNMMLQRLNPTGHTRNRASRFEALCLLCASLSLW